MNNNNLLQFDAENKQLLCQGEWNLACVTAIKKSLASLSLPAKTEIIVDGSHITKMDSGGAWLLNNWAKKQSHSGITLHLQNFSEQQQKLLKLIEEQSKELKELPRVERLDPLAKLGQGAIDLLDEFSEYLTFFGYLTCEAFRVLFNPKHWRFNSLVSVIDTTGFRGLPIIALLSFMIGVVIAYQMGLQLKNYGANIFIVDLLGLSILREFGPLITAIMVAGRTGSAFTAQLGTMKVNQEIDALNTMGVTPAELLLLPRIFGLIITLPLLTMWADIFGIFGGMIMANNMLHISWADFLMRFEQQIPLRALLIGLGKAPVFAILIATIGCFEGMKVKGSADSVGTHTTRSVVLSIFFIIVTDAAFSILFSKFKL